ncbi:hypothetical protein PC117_g12237 [Phytophthora cactorum]|uniref:Uncharacterized protein n=1 Tax=Phytophthora cactorum TaxID=29920 RepID=A0A8T1D639_9STRA|nr:hypothetical protein PC117_g12237 [Phytophthora cactorum]
MAHSPADSTCSGRLTSRNAFDIASDKNLPANNNSNEIQQQELQQPSSNENTGSNESSGDSAATGAPTASTPTGARTDTAPTRVLTVLAPTRDSDRNSDVPAAARTPTAWQRQGL